jgi:hypothetical protein
MHPIIGYQLSQNHLAGLRHQAQRTALARAARRARRARSPQPGHPGPALPALAWQAMTVAGHRRHATAPAGAPKHKEGPMSKLRQVQWSAREGVGSAGYHLRNTSSTRR